MPRADSERAAVATFRLGEHDVSDQFRIPQKLYGRERKENFLFEEFGKAARGEARVVLFSGPSGIGKTALVNEMRKTVSEKKGYFSMGHFEKSRGELPYDAFIMAFQSLIRQLLTESEEKLKVGRRSYKKRLERTGIF